MERSLDTSIVDVHAQTPEGAWRDAFVSHVHAEWENLTPQTIGLLADEAWRHPAFAQLAGDAAAARWLARRASREGRC